MNARSRIASRVSAHRALASLVAAMTMSAALLGGCGSSNESTEAAVTISVKQFQGRANHLCKAARARYFAAALKALEGEEQANPGVPQEKLEYKVIARLFPPNYRKEIEEIRAMEIPPSELPGVEKVLAATEEELSEMEADPDAFRKEQVATQKKFATSFALAKRYGIDFCGQP